jgi:hypothetical protein
MKAKFKISLTLGDKVYTGKGETALDALRAIERPAKIQTKGIFVVSQGKLKKQMLLTVPRLKRFFYPSAQPILIKQLVTGMK